MFTRKQQWRRIIKQTPESRSIMDFFDSEFEFDSLAGPSRVELNLNGSSAKKTLSLDSGLAAKNVSTTARPKRVTFSHLDIIILVPQRQEYFDHKLDKKLWWSTDDYAQFKHSAILEISALMNIYRIDAKTAIHKFANGDFDEKYGQTNNINSKPERDNMNSDNQSQGQPQSFVSNIHPSFHPGISEYYTNLNAMPTTSDTSINPMIPSSPKSCSHSSIKLHPLAYIAH